jgi:hypothetical protein
MVDSLGSRFGALKLYINPLDFYVYKSIVGGIWNQAFRIPKKIESGHVKGAGSKTSETADSISTLRA